jgi:hypothetical protein
MSETISVPKQPKCGVWGFKAGLAPTVIIAWDSL